MLRHPSSRFERFAVRPRSEWLRTLELNEQFSYAVHYFIRLLRALVRVQLIHWFAQFCLFLEKTKILRWIWDPAEFFLLRPIIYFAKIFTVLSSLLLDIPKDVIPAWNTDLLEVLPTRNEILFYPHQIQLALPFIIGFPNRDACHDAILSISSPKNN